MANILKYIQYYSFLKKEHSNWEMMFDKRLMSLC